MKKVSVLIAAFAAELWIEQCVRSIQKQTLPQDWILEILIGIDGCGTTLQAAKCLKHQQLKIISLKKNYGTYITFNTLMKFTSGDLICRFDADDVMLQDYLGAQIPLLAESADMTMTWCISTDEKLRPGPANSNYRTLGHGQFMIRRSVWDALGGFRPWRCGADTDFNERAKVLGLTIKVVEKFLYYRRRHANSLTAHPDTNFDSALRKNIIARVDDYIIAYRQLHLPVKIEPVVGDVDQIFV